MRSIEKKAGLILGGIFLFSLVLVGFVMATSHTGTATATATVTVNTFLSVTVDSATLDFSSLNPGTTNNKPTNDPLVATIGAESNVVAKVETKADNINFVFGSEDFPVSNMDWSPNNSAWTAYSDTVQGQVCGSVSAGGNCLIYHQLTIPDAQAAGTYSVGITITAR